jgi:protein-tyrosine phosphatase
MLIDQSYHSANSPIYEIYPKEPYSFIVSADPNIQKIDINVLLDKALIFRQKMLPLSPDSYFLTTSLQESGRYTYFYRAGRRQSKNYYLNVHPPRGESWQKGVSYKQVYPNLHVGNAASSYHAEQLRFDAVLNLTEKIIFHFPASINYKHLPLTDFGHNPIPESLIIKGVQWIIDQLQQGRKVCINCRAGIGRSGSLAIATVYALNPHLNFHQVINSVRHGSYPYSSLGKQDIYPHKSLMDSLSTLFPSTQRQPLTEIKQIELINTPLGTHITMPQYHRLRIWFRVYFQGTLPPYVIVRTNLAGEIKDFPATHERNNLYYIDITPQKPGGYWLTARASNYLTTTPVWFDQDVWLGKEGENLWIDVKD